MRRLSRGPAMATMALLFVIAVLLATGCVVGAAKVSADTGSLHFSADTSHDTSASHHLLRAPTDISSRLEGLHRRLQQVSALDLYQVNSTAATPTNATRPSGSTAILGVAAQPACPYWSTRIDGSPGLLASGILQDDRDPTQPPLMYGHLRDVLLAANKTEPGLVSEHDAEVMVNLLLARAFPFLPLGVQEQLAATQYLTTQPELSITPLANATMADNHIMWLELAPQPKAPTQQFLADLQDLWQQFNSTVKDAATLKPWMARAKEVAKELPDRYALAVVAQRRADPPRVVQLKVGPLPQPTSWQVVPLSPTACSASWWQRTHSQPEGHGVEAVIEKTYQRLKPVMLNISDGFSLEDDCGDKCLTYSFSAPFGTAGYTDEDPYAASTTQDGGSTAGQTSLTLPGNAPTNQPTNRVVPYSGRKLLQQTDAAGADGGSAAGDAGASAAPAAAANASTPETNLSCSWNSTTGPREVSPQRGFWVYWYRNLEGHHLHTLGIEMLVDVGHLDPSEWWVTRVWMGGMMFSSPEEVLEVWNGTAGNATLTNQLHAFKPFLPVGEEALYSTFKPRPNTTTRGAPDQQRGQPATPVQYEPAGRRFVLDGLHLSDWLGWSLTLGHSPTKGLSAWDVRFKGQRLAWEVSLQEAYAGYGGPDPVQSTTVYQDTAWFMGAALKPLMPGVDCPLNAALLDLSFTANSPQPVTSTNALCVFEHANGMPLLRHWSDNGGVSVFYGGVPATTLVIRGMASVYNYDYVYDMLLHMDGAMEMRVHTTGYPQAAWWSPEQGYRYAHPMARDISGTIHDHLLHWKVDVDIGRDLRTAGRNNSVRIDEMSMERKTDKDIGWGPRPWYSKVMTPHLAETEPEAALVWNSTTLAAPDQVLGPRLLNIINEGDTNKWGSPRGYKLQLSGGNPQVLPPPPTFNATKGVAWSYYQTAVTQRKETEQFDAHPLNQALPAAPIVSLSDMINPGESVRHQDVVLWVTSGLMHYVGSEDAPSTPTTGTGMGFILRPFNFFDENAATDLKDMVYLPGPVSPTNTTVTNATIDAINAFYNGSRNAYTSMQASWPHPVGQQPYLPLQGAGTGPATCRATYSGAVPFRYLYG